MSLISRAASLRDALRHQAEVLGHCYGAAATPYRDLCEDVADRLDRRIHEDLAQRVPPMTLG